MKWIVLAALLFTFLGADISYAGGAEISFQWTQPSDHTWGTKIYIGTSPGVYTYSEDAGGNTSEDCPEGVCTYTQSNLPWNKKHYFTATHFDVNGFESEKTPEITWTSPDVPGISFEPMPEITDNGVTIYQFILNIPTN